MKIKIWLVMIMTTRLVITRMVMTMMKTRTATAVEESYASGPTSVDAQQPLWWWTTGPTSAGPAGADAKASLWLESHVWTY